MELSPNSSAVLSDSGDVELLTGQEFPSLSQDEKQELSGPQQTARKIDGVVVCAARIDETRVLLHAYGMVPDNISISKLLHFVRTSANSERAQISAPTQADSVLSDALKKAAQAAALVLPKNRLQVFLDELCDNGFNKIVALAAVRFGKVGRVLISDRKHAAARDALTVILAAKLAGDQEGASTQLDEDLVAQKLGGKRLTIIPPEDGQNGLILVGLDLSAKAVQLLEEHLGYFSLLLPYSKRGSPYNKYLIRASVISLLLGLLVFLSWPAPVYVENIAQARARESLVISLPFPAFLDQALVRPGKVLKKGERAVMLHSPDIEQAIAEQKLTQNLEGINAQEALSSGDYAKVQLAEKRQEIARLREAQFRERLSLLTVTSPIDGIVTSVQSSGVTGSYLQAGTPILEIQPSAQFDIDVEISPIDAAIIKPGQKGLVYFRGLSSETYEFEMVTGAIQTIDPQTQKTRLQARARLITANQNRLLVGLSGFAKINTGLQPRIYGWSRPVIEYVRLTLWKYLGLDF